MSAQGQRLNVVSSNIANADSATSADGKTYRAKQVIFSAVPTQNAGATGVKVQQVVEDASPLKMMYDPKHPQADEKGYVAMPNVNVVEEMVNMISASRSYQTNAETMNTAKTMLLKTLTLGQ
ncbi:MAG: flgC [Burkholderia sp.]|jgi:flagellar basal-body rod protein FlgC|nr:flgC [Burkholderia sp.]